jgi:hypothetical protein
VRAAPAEFCSLHERAMNALSSDWQSARKLIKTTEVDCVAFDDLVTWKLAERLDEPITEYGVSRGARTYFRLSEVKR